MTQNTETKEWTQCRKEAQDTMQIIFDHIDHILYHTRMKSYDFIDNDMLCEITKNLQDVRKMINLAYEQEYRSPQ